MKRHKDSVQKPDEPAMALTPAMFQVLVAIGQDEKHGYAILKEVEEQSGGDVRLSTGTLYALIKRLLAEGMIQECRNRPPADQDDQRRRYYRLTAFGLQVAMAEAERMERWITAAREKHLMRRLRPA
jgi:DNA-binding PadR family transcriptional regulator